MSSVPDDLRREEEKERSGRESLRSSADRRYDARGRLMAEHNPIVDEPRSPERHMLDIFHRDNINAPVELPDPVPDFTSNDDDNYRDRGHRARAPKEETYYSRWDTLHHLAVEQDRDSIPPRPSRSDVTGDRVRHVPFVAGRVSTAHERLQVTREPAHSGGLSRQFDPNRIAERLARSLLLHHEAPEPIRKYTHRPPAAPYPNYPVHVDLNILADRRHQSPPRFGELDLTTEDTSVALRGRPVIDPSNEDSTHRVIEEAKMPWPVRDADLDHQSTSAKDYLRHATDSIYASALNRQSERPGATEIAVFENRLRFLEAELKARVEKAIADEGERKRMEDAWTQELTANRIRVSEQQKEINECHDIIRQLRSALACRDGEVSALKAARDTAEGTVNSAKSKAEREAMGTVLSQQRLITLMEEERDSLQKKNSQLSAAIDELVEENKQLQLDAMEWRTKALATEQAFVSFAGERASAAAQKDMGQLYDDSAEEENDRPRNSQLPMEKRRDDAKLAAQVLAKRYIEKKNDENPALILNAKYLDRDVQAERQAVSQSSNHGLGDGGKDIAVSQEDYAYRPDHSRRLVADLTSSRARVEEALNYKPEVRRNKRSLASDWAPRLGKSTRCGIDLPSSYQARTPELKDWLRGSSAHKSGVSYMPRGAFQNQYGGASSYY